MGRSEREAAQVGRTCRDVCAALLLPNRADTARVLAQRARVNAAGGVVGVNDCGEEVPLHLLAQEVSERIAEGSLRPPPPPRTSEPTTPDGKPVGQLTGMDLEAATEEYLRGMGGRYGV
jgi:hypothetical protein